MKNTSLAIESKIPHLNMIILKKKSKIGLISSCFSFVPSFNLWFSSDSIIFLKYQVLIIPFRFLTEQEEIGNK